MNDAAFARVVHKIDPGARLLSARALKGGISARVTALEIERPDGERQKLVLRQHGEADRRRNPQVAADEFRLLALLQAEGVAAPTPVLLDQTGEIFPEPYVVVEFVEGSADFAPASLPDALRQMAQHLARVHGISGPGGVLLHGDFWPGNLLWRDGRLVAIIDWEDAAWGDPLADVANARLEILWAFGVDAMQQFTQQYRGITGIDCAGLPTWDLRAAERLAHFPEWAPGDRIATMRERYDWFVGQARAELAGRGSDCASE